MCSLSNGKNREFQCGTVPRRYVARVAIKSGQWHQTSLNRTSDCRVDIAHAHFAENSSGIRTN